MIERRRRVSVVVFVCMLLAGVAIYKGVQQSSLPLTNKNSVAQVAGVAITNPDGSPATLASDALKQIAVKGRAPKTDYSREQFGGGWQDLGDCDIRNVVLARDMDNVTTVSDTDCNVLSGTLQDPYTGKLIMFKRGPTTSNAVQIDHVVALSDAWQKGAQNISPDKRLEFANDLLNLLAVDGPINQQKSDSDAASWLPPNKDYRCRYVARQIAVKIKYLLWMTPAEHDATAKVLESCPSQVLPLISLVPSLAP